MQGKPLWTNIVDFRILGDYACSFGKTPSGASRFMRLRKYKEQRLTTLFGMGA